MELGAKNVTELPFEAAERMEIAEELLPRAVARPKIAKSLRNNLAQGCELVFFMLDAHVIPGRWRAGFGVTRVSEL